MTNNKILVVDTESFCWEGRYESGNIIQIGYCILDLKLNTIKKKSYFIRPYDISKVEELSDFCTNLTGITKKHLYKGFLLEEVLRIMIKDGCNNITWAGYGDDKSHILDEYYIGNPLNGDIYLIGFKPPASYIDVSLLFNFKTRNFGKFSLINALKYFNLEFEGRQHRADDDAFNTAKLLLELLK